MKGRIGNPARRPLVLPLRRSGPRRRPFSRECGSLPVGRGIVNEEWGGTELDHQRALRSTKEIPWRRVPAKVMALCCCSRRSVDLGLACWCWLGWRLRFIAEIMGYFGFGLRATGILMDRSPWSLTMRSRKKVARRSLFFRSRISRLVFMRCCRTRVTAPAGI